MPSKNIFETNIFIRKEEACGRTGNKLQDFITAGQINSTTQKDEILRSSPNLSSDIKQI